MHIYYNNINPSRITKEGGDETNHRTWAKPQRIVEQAYSRAYSTQSQLSRLQTICIGDSSKFRFTFTATSIMLATEKSIVRIRACTAYFFACITDRNVAFQHGF